MESTSLLDWSEKQARASDPATSHEAAALVRSRLAGLRAQFVEGVVKCGGTATANEAAAAIEENPMARESIRKRAKECLDRGAVRIVGTRECKISGGNCRVYEAI